MGLFTRDQLDKINKVAEKSKSISDLKPTNIKVNSVNSEIQEMSQAVIDYFKDSEAILVNDITQLHDYVTHAIEAGFVGIDTETTGLDRIKDHVVGASLYYPGGIECYIPMKHKVPIFEEPYRGQLTYENVQVELQRFVDSNTKMIFANADFDLAMINKDLKVDMNDICYYDVLLAWRCLKENERDNSLKALYNKYVLKGKGDPKKFSDFFSPQLFPYCKPEVAKLYAANDAKITYELFKWQLPYVTKTHPKCQKHHLESIADLIWNIELPLIKICQNMHRTGIYLDKEIASSLVVRYNAKLEKEKNALSIMVDDILEKTNYHLAPLQKVPFKTGAEFSATSTMHVKHLIYTIMNIPQGKGGTKTDKTVLGELNLPVTNQILKVRSLNTLISTFVEKLPKATTLDDRIHCQFRQIGASTGRMCIAEGTPIRIYNGTKPIEELKEGDIVYCCKKEKNSMTTSEVVHVWHTGYKNCIKVSWSSLEDETGYVICTPEHLFLTHNGWVEASKLQSKELLIHPVDPVVVVDWLDLENLEQLKKSFAEVTSIEELPNKYNVYDIEVKNYHNFIAGGVCVHNSSAEPNMQNIPSHADDIRHMFRASPGYVMLSSDYS